MEKEQNQLLEYTIDTLLKTFNPERKPIMKKSHFFKMMDLLDTRLQKKGIDINYPKYWYRYGSVAHMEVLGQNIPHGFLRYIDDDSIISPYPCRLAYNIDDELKVEIRSTIAPLCEKYQYQTGYGRLLKTESYRINAPFAFNTTFQNLFDILSRFKNPCQAGLFTLHDELEPLLDTLLEQFPDEKYPELIDMHLAWDDTTRVIISYIEDKKLQERLLEELVELFWKSYSNAIKIDCNQHIPPEIIKKWEIEYEGSIVPTLLEIENIRKKVITVVELNTDPYDSFAKKIMQKAYDLDI
jgi:hypothetical protein